MKPLFAVAVACLLVASPCILAASPFDGTWRPDPQRPPADAKPDVFALDSGTYECRTCAPSYKVKADGVDHAVSGSEYYDTLNITLVDSHTVTKIAKKGGQPVAKTISVVSPDGKTLTESQSLYGMGPNAIELTSHSARTAAGAAGAHAISGSWRLLDTDLTNHDEDTTFKVSDGALAMTDRMGRSFTAKLDGSDAPYRGDPDVTSVSLKVIDSRALEEYDKKDGKVVKVSRWTIDPDGTTMHARFDNTRGRVQTQDGHKVEGTG
jgi:hypothetical protein